MRPSVAKVVSLSEKQQHAIDLISGFSHKNYIPCRYRAQLTFLSTAHCYPVPCTKDRYNGGGSSPEHDKNNLITIVEANKS
jgi:hypothetical protein